MIRPRVVCIGGGTGQAQVLRGLSRFPVRLTSIVNVTDNGGHSGFLRRELDIPPVGDIRNCIAALAPEQDVLADLLRVRFHEGTLDGTSLGNLILAALTQAHGSLAQAVEALRRALRIAHEIYPVADQQADICAVLDNGKVVTGEWQILLRKPRRPIARLFHDPPLDSLPACRRALRRANLIVLCPGALMTAVVSCLLAGGIRKAIADSHASIAQVCNIMTMPAQTDGMTAEDHLLWMSRFLPRSPDFFIVNRTRPPASLLRHYRQVGSTRVIEGSLGAPGVKVIRAALLMKCSAGDERGGEGRYRSLPHSIRHDPRKLAALLYRLAKRS